MEGKCFYFIVRSGRFSQNGKEYMHWEWSKSFSSKESLRRHFTNGSQKVKASEIYSAEQFIERFSNKQTLRSALEEAIHYSGVNGSF